MNAHKEAYHKAIPKYSCLLCAANLESYKTHKEKHNKMLSVGSTNKYPMNGYTFKCKPCKLSFRNHDALIDHMVTVHVPERKRPLKESSYEEEKDALPSPVQLRSFPRQSPDSQWQTVQNRRPRHGGPGGQQRQAPGDQQQGHGDQRRQGRGDQQWQDKGDQQWQG